MKVLVISDYRSYHTVRPEAEIFIGLKKEGVDVEVMTFPESEYYKIFEEHGIPVIPFHPEKKYDRKGIKVIRATIQKGAYDIVHLFNSKASTCTLKAVKGIPIKVCLYRGFTGHIHWYDPSLYFKYMHPRVNKIVCNSQGVENEFLKEPFIPKDKTRVINKGHDTDWYKDIEASKREEFGLSDDTFLLCNVANNRPMKGIKYLLDSMNHLPDDMNFRLLMIGGGMDTEENRAIIAKGAHSDKVIFTGFRKDALSIVKMCHVFVLSSLWGESITKSVIEAMSLGVMPIITDISGNKELAVDGTSGLVVPAGTLYP